MTRFLHAAGSHPAIVKPELEIMSKLAKMAKMAKMRMTG
jgi:hypothetical protein